MSPRVRLALLVGLSLLLMSPTIFQGFIVDDPMILSVIEERYPDRPHSFDIYSVLHHQWELPWWISPAFDLKFSRPLGSALLRADHAIFGRWAPGWHLHSLLWLALFALASALLWNRIDPRLGWLVLLICMLDESFGFIAGWISNRHTLVAMAFGVAALWAHLRWREDGWRPGLPLACLFFVLALATSESGLVAFAYVGVYELFAGPGSLRQRLRGLAPALAIGLGYAILYSALGYGVHGGAAIYVDPAADPLPFLAEASVRVPILLGGGILGSPPHLWMFPEMRPMLVTIGLLSIAVLLGALRLGWKTVPETWRRHLWWLLPGALLSCIPLVAAFPSHRQMIGPMVGIAPALAVVLFLIRRDFWPAGSWRRWAGALLGLLLVLAHFVGAPALQVGAVPILRQTLHDGIVKNLESVPHWDPADGFEDVVVLKGSDGMTTFYGPVFLDDRHGTRRGHWNVLSVAPFDHRWTRSGLRELELEVLGGEMLTTVAETHYPLQEDLVAGREIEFRGTRIRILEMGSRGPRKVAFEFPRELDDPRLLFLAWGEEGFRQVAAPALGESVVFAHVASHVQFP